MKRIAILGLAKSGIAAAYKLKELGYQPFLSELRPKSQVKQANELTTDFDCEFGIHSDKLFSYDTIVVSPGIPLQNTIIQRLKSKKKELISEIELGFRLKHPDSKIIAITGSNGKSTTVSLIHHILKSAGFNSVLAGNIGTAFTSYPIEKNEIDFIVLEVSSFQLDLIQSFKPNVAAILNITPDHLNRYKDFEEYGYSKFSIFKNNSISDTAIINCSDDVIMKYANNLEIRFKYISLHNTNDITIKKDSYQYNNFVYQLHDSKLAGRHNMLNSMAAVAATEMFISNKGLIQKGITSFQPLPHRLEEFHAIGDIIFVNDSKATNTDSVKYSLASFNRPVRIILGGSDKGEDFQTLLPNLRKYAKKIYLIGETKNKMEMVFKGNCLIETFSSLQTCVEKAYKDSDAGDVILLSPACASFDMFQNYEDRGNQFKKIVRKLS